VTGAHIFLSLFIWTPITIITPVRTPAIRQMAEDIKSGKIALFLMSDTVPNFLVPVDHIHYIKNKDTRNFADNWAKNATISVLSELDYTLIINKESIRDPQRS